MSTYQRRCDGCSSLVPVHVLARTAAGRLCVRCRPVTDDAPFAVAPVRPLQRPAPGSLTLFQRAGWER